MSNPRAWQRRQNDTLLIQFTCNIRILYGSTLSDNVQFRMDLRFGSRICVTSARIFGGIIHPQFIYGQTCFRYFGRMDIGSKAQWVRVDITIHSYRIFILGDVIQFSFFVTTSRQPLKLLSEFRILQHLEYRGTKLADLIGGDPGMTIFVVENSSP